jgi:hypothetical protein
LTPYGVEFVEMRDLQRIFIMDVGGPHTFRTVYMTAARIRRLSIRAITGTRPESGKATRSSSTLLVSMKDSGSPEASPQRSAFT